MRSRLLRAFLALTTLAVVWLVVTPARADEAVMSMMTTMSVAPMSPATVAPPPAPTSLANKAPLCDPRGAITFADAPQMQDLEVTLDTGMTAEDCLASSERNESYRASPGRAPLPIDASSASSDAAVLTAVVTLAASARELTPAPAASTTCSRPVFAAPSTDRRAPEESLIGL